MPPRRHKHYITIFVGSGTTRNPILCGGPKVSGTPQKLHSDVTLLDMVGSTKKYITSNISNHNINQWYVCPSVTIMR